MKTVAFTGYRRAKMPFSESESDINYLNFRKKLRAVIERLIELGYTNFITGLADGFDTWAAEDVLFLQEINPNIKLECAIPFPGQADDWSLADQKRRYAIITKAAKSYIVCRKYESGCYYKRNRRMVDRAHVVVCAYDGKSGGTEYTVEYALKSDRVIIKINPVNCEVVMLNGLVK